MDPALTIDSPLISPATARQAAIQAKDWVYVNSWLARHYGSKPVPKFERNKDNLRALLALAAVNDGADEEAILLHRAREEVFARIQDPGGKEDKHQKALLDDLEISLDCQSRQDLEDLAESAVILARRGRRPRKLDAL